MGNFSTTSVFGGTYTSETVSDVVGIHHSDNYCAALSWTNATGDAKTAVCGKSEVHTVTFPDEAGTTHGDYLSLTDTNGLKWAVALSKGGVAEQTTITCIGEGTITAVAEQTSIVAIAETGVAAQTTVLCTADTAINPLDQETFILYDKAGSVGVWIDSDAAETAPVEALACTRQIKVTITALDLIGTVGTAIYNALDSDSQFIGVSNDTAGTIVIKDAVGGVRTAGTKGTTPFTVTNNVVGVVSNLDGKYFVLNDEGGSVGVWFDVDNRGTSAPSTGCTRTLEVTTVATGDSAATIGGLLRTAIDADSKFNQSGAGSTCVAVNIATQALAQHANAGTSGFAVTTTVNGRTAVASSLHQKYFKLGDATGSSTVGFWFDVDNAGALAPTTGATRDVEITTVTSGMSSAQVAAVVRTAIDGDSKFNVGTLTDSTFNAVCKDLISVADASAGDSGFTVVVAVQGTALGAEPTGAIWAAIPAARKGQANAYSVAGTKTAITIAGLAVTALNALSGFTDVVTLADIGDGTVTVTHVVRGPVTLAVPKSVNDAGAGSITVADSTNGVASTVSVSANTLTIAAHGWTTGLKVVLTVAPGSLPTGLAGSVDEFVIVVDADTIKIADTLAYALAGTARDITDQGTDGSTITVTPTAVAGAVVKVQASVDNVVWYDISGKTSNITATSSALHEVVDAAYNYVRVHFTCTAGQVTLAGKVSQKG